MGSTVKKIKKTKVATGLIIVLFCFLISVTGVSFFMLYKDTIYTGIMIEDVNVGGVSPMEAQRKIGNHFDRKLSSYKIQFTHGDKIWDMDVVNDLGLRYDYTSAVHKAYNVGREGSYYERLKRIFSLYKTPYNISVEPIYDHNKFNIFIGNIKNDIDKPPKDAAISRKNGVFIITGEEMGLKLDIDKTKELMNEEIKKLKDTNRASIGLKVEDLSPQITSENLSSISDLLGAYTTKFNSSNKSRSRNVLLAARAMDGTVLMPNQVFSFNEVVGARTKDRGYQEAPVIFNGELVEGLGGGVCQVSSTMYNAILLSDLKVVERVKHTIPSTYVPKGQDATVSYGVLDFKFQNTLSQPIYLESYVKGNLITINIFGYKTNDRVVKIESTEDEFIKRPIEVRTDPNMFEGQERIEQKGRDGYKITTYKVIYEKGAIIEKKKISKDYYRPQKQILFKGTKKRPPAASQPTESKQSE